MGGAQQASRHSLDVRATCLAVGVAAYGLHTVATLAIERQHAVEGSRERTVQNVGRPVSQGCLWQST